MESASAANRTRSPEGALPPGGKVYIQAVIAAGVPVILYCVGRSLIQDDLRWLYLAVLTAIASCLPVKVPLLGDKRQLFSITIGDVFVFTAILFFGPYVSVAVAAVEAAVTNFRTGTRSLYKQLFNLAQLSLVAFTVGWLFYLFEGQAPPFDPTGTSSLTAPVINLVVCMILYFLLNSGLVAAAMAATSGRPLLQLWRRNFLWALPADVANALTALVALPLAAQAGFSLTAVIIPPALLLYCAHNEAMRRMMQA
ncbi:MAG: hypothetical protein HY315_05085 [Acidobacteria bacterium]|nr:hypothetical protein [Acidobacteriota bacterium]